MKDVVANVAYREFVRERYFRLGLKIGWNEFQPGQFVMIEVPNGQTFLRRPFGIVKADGGVLEVCIKVVGKGTAALSKICEGQSVSVLGPLGKGFSIKKETRSAVLVAGGYGVAPLLALARHVSGEKKNVVFYYGSKSSADLLYLDQLKGLGADLRLSTEDGSEGAKGLITQRVAQDISGFENAEMFACGPQGLLSEIAKIAKSTGIPAQVSLERYMACGIGVCLGCVVKMKDGSYQRACREGPVFDSESILWEGENNK